MSRNPPTLVFSHANSFPAGCYEGVFDRWRREGWRVLALPKFGHNPQFPVTQNWPHLRDELLDFIERKAPPHQPLWFVGHSMGGYLSLLAASSAPERCAGVVLVDAPVVAGWRAHSLRVAQLTGLGDRFSPAHVSKKRRQHWPDAAALQAHFESKTAFKRWAPRALRDYLACGFEPDAEQAGLRLGFEREVETRLYRTLPHHLEALLKRHPPGGLVAFVGGTQSVEVRWAGLAFTKRLCANRLLWVEGAGHLLPMEKPRETAAAVLKAIGQLQKAQSICYRASE